MKLFENGVGRPSNETIRKRRIFYCIIALLVVGLLGGGFYAIRNSSIPGIGKNATRKYRVNFYANGAKVGKSKIYCTPKSGVCQVTTPSIKRSGYQIIGWGTEGSATNAVFQPGQKINVYKNVSYYAITKKTYTATFNSSGLEYIEHKKLTCNVYNKNKNCTIILPKYEKQGVYNNYWSSVKLPSTNLTGKPWKSAYFNEVLDTYKLSANTTFYPNFNPTSHKDKKGKIAHDVKYKNLKIHSTVNIGKTLFEFESGVDNYVIKEYEDGLKKVYKQMPWLFSDGKIFVVTEKTFAEKVNDLMDIKFINNKYFVGELHNANGFAADNFIPELGLAWDNYYYGTFGSHIYDVSEDFNELYNKLVKGKKSSGYQTKQEMFEGMCMNYYNHILKNDTNAPYIQLISGKTLSSSEKKLLKKVIEEYGKITTDALKGDIGFGDIPA